jgi:hypothetical protein
MTKDFYSEHLEWCLRQMDQPELKKHPVVNRLMNLYIERLQAYCGMPLVMRMAPIARALESEMQELGGWAFRQRHLPWTDEDDDHVGTAFDNLRFSYKDAKKAARQVHDLNAKIRPHSNRAIAIRAKELKDADSSLNWADVTERVCECQHRHTKSCTESLKVAVSDLNKLLSKYQEVKP